MNSIKNICVITNAYPFKGISLQPFVEQLVNTFIDIGIHCDVVVPRSITHSIIRKTPLPPEVYTASTPKNNKYTVYFPRYLSLSSSDGIFGPAVEKFNLSSFTQAVKKTVKKNDIKPDAFYGHFFNQGGLAAAEMSCLYGKPYFVACGENYLTSLDKMGVDWVKHKLSEVSGVISVSTHNKNELLKRGYVKEEKIDVFVNSIDNKLFYPRNKEEMRRKYKIDDKAFIVCFVGRLLDVKGPKRLSSALDRTDGIYSVFLGTGPERPDCKNILHCGMVTHDQVPEYLSLSDVFVLPTLAEGCCNAIIEAMACGLPVISSNLPFNDDILEDAWSIRIDPTDVNAIRNAIVFLRDNGEVCAKMSAAAMNRAESLNIVRRAENILKFMESKI